MTANCTNRVVISLVFIISYGEHSYDVSGTLAIEKALKLTSYQTHTKTKATIYLYPLSNDCMFKVLSNFVLENLILYSVALKTIPLFCLDAGISLIELNNCTLMLSVDRDLSKTFFIYAFLSTVKIPDDGLEATIVLNFSEIKNTFFQKKTEYFLLMKDLDKFGESSRGAHIKISNSIFKNLRIGFPGTKKMKITGCQWFDSYSYQSEKFER